MTYPPGEAASYQGASGANTYSSQAYANNMPAPSDEDHPDRGLFSSALSSFMGQHHEQQGVHTPAQPHEIQDAEHQHQQLYGRGSGGGDYGAYGPPPSHMNPDNIGTAAAYEAVRSSPPGGDLQSIIMMAMKEVSKFYSQSQGTAGGGSSNDKSASIQKAISMAVKFYLQKQGGSGSGGSSGGGGVASMISAAMGQLGGGHQQQQQQQPQYQQHQQQSSGLGGILGSLTGGNSHSGSQGGGGGGGAGNLMGLASQFLNRK